MARVTVEDCKLQVPNRFDLVILAAQRAKQIASGIPLTIPRDNDKDTVVALRELAARSFDPIVLRDSIISGFRKNHPTQDEDENIINDGVSGEGSEGEVEGLESIDMLPYSDNIDIEEMEGFEEIDLDEHRK